MPSRRSHIHRERHTGALELNIKLASMRWPRLGRVYTADCSHYPALSCVRLACTDYIAYITYSTSRHYLSRVSAGVKEI